MRKLFTLVATAAGVCFGMMFAKKSGQKLREELTKAKTGKKRAQLLVDEFLKMGKDAAKEIEKLKDSKEVKALIKKGKMKANDLTKEIKKRKDEIVKTAKKEGKKLVKKGKKAVKSKTTKKKSTKAKK